MIQMLAREIEADQYNLEEAWKMPPTSKVERFIKRNEKTIHESLIKLGRMITPHAWQRGRAFEIGMNFYNEYCNDVVLEVAS